MITNLARNTRLPCALLFSQAPAPAQKQIVPAPGEPFQAVAVDSVREERKTVRGAILIKLNEWRCAVRGETAPDDRDSRDFWLKQTGHALSRHGPKTGIDSCVGHDRTATAAADSAPARKHIDKPLAEPGDSADNTNLLQNTEDSGIRSVPVHIDREAS